MKNNPLYRAGLVMVIGVGMISLFLQALWQRQLAILTGNTLYGISLVVGAWMAGYGAGSFLVLWLLPKLRRPLLFLVWTQIGVCGLALLFVPWFEVMRLFPKPWVYLASFFSVFVPSLSWGMTLPFVGAVFGTSAVSRLYGWNTLASAVGIILMDFVFLPLLGARASLLVSVAIGMGIFSGGLVFFSRYEKITERKKNVLFHYRTGGIILVLSGISGFTSLGYQLIYNRQLLYFTGNTLFCYGIITAVFIGGLALGTFLYAQWREKMAGRLFFWMGILEGGISLWHAGFPSLSVGVNNLLVPLKGEGLGTLFLLRILASGLLIGIPVMFFGMLYPMFIEAFHNKNQGHDGGDTALAAGVNTIGSVVGILLVAFFFIDRIGISGTLRLLAWISGCIASAFLIMSREIKMAGTLIVVALALVFLPVEDKIGRIAAQEFRGSEILYYKEGAHGTVSVTLHPEGILHLKINGVGEVPTDYHSLRVFRFLGYVPFGFSPSATNVLVVALGGGITFGSVMEVPGVMATDVEICPDVKEAAIFFTNYNHDVVRKYATNITFDDGVTYLLRSRERYDIIIADATHPASGDSWVLYTREFYAMGKERLVSGGIMAQWVPMHNLSVEDFQVIVKTFASVFSSVRLYFCHEYFVMIGSDTPLTFKNEGWTRLLKNPIVNQDLAIVHLFPRAIEDMLIWESGEDPLWTNHLPLSTIDFSPLQFAELRSRGKDTRIDIISFLLKKKKFGYKTQKLLELHRDFLGKNYISALYHSYSLPSSWRDEAWEYQEKRIEKRFLLSLRTPEGIQMLLEQKHPETMPILQKLQDKDALFVGVARALVLASHEHYQEAEKIFTELLKTYPQPWLKEMLSQIQKEREK